MTKQELINRTAAFCYARKFHPTELTKGVRWAIKELNLETTASSVVLETQRQLCAAYPEGWL